MDFRDIDGKTQMKCLVSLEQTSPVSTLLRGFDQAIPCFVYRDGEDVLMNMYFNKSDTERKEISQILNYPEAVDKGDFFVVREKISNIREISVIDEILQVPTVVLGQTYVLKGFLYLGFRFHIGFSKGISEILSRFVGNEYRGKVVDLGPTSGMITTVEQMNGIIPLSMVRYVIPLASVEERRDLPIPKLDWLAEVVDSRIAQREFKTLIHVQKSGMEDFRPPRHWVRIDDTTFESNFSNRFMSRVREMANDDLIPRYAYVVRPKAGHLQDQRVIEISVFLPTVAVESYTDMLFRLAGKFFNGEMYITVIRKYCSSIWDSF